jgi:hypothetical protein
MSIRYTGPYAEQVEQHEGHAASKFSDGTMSPDPAATASPLAAYLAACSCGWQGAVEHAATEQGEEAAEAQWKAEHLGPLIDAARAGWDTWPDQLMGQASYVRDRVRAADPAEALRILDQMIADVDSRRRTVNRLTVQPDQ